jgi:hypothetical protein
MGVGTRAVASDSPNAEGSGGREAIDARILECRLSSVMRVSPGPTSMKIG